jgi:hypothetical protein
MGIPTSIGNSLPAIIITKSASPAINPNDAAVPAGSPPIGAVASASNEALSADQIPTDTLLAYTMPPVVTTDTPATLADIPTVLTDKTTVLDLSQTAPTQTMFGIKQFNLPDIQLDKSNLMVLQNTNQTYLQRYTLDNQSQLTVKPDSPTGSTSGMSWTDVSVANNSSANVIASGSGNLNFNGTNTSTGGTITLNTNSNNAVSFHISSNGKDNASTNATNQLSLTTQGGNDQINLGKTLSNGTFTQTNLQGLSGTINTGAGNDVVTLSALDDANTNLIIDGGDGKDTVVATGSDKDWKLAAIMVDDDGNTVSTVENQNTKALYQLKNIEEFRFASGGGLSLTDKPLREIKGPGEVVKNPTTPEEIANDPRPLTLVNGQAVLTNEVNYISQINPVFGETSQQTLQRILNDAPPPPTARPGWIPKLKGLQPGQGPSTYVPQYVLARTYTPEQKQNIIDASLAADTDGQFTPESLGKMLNEFPEEWDPADTEPPPSGLPVIVGKVTHSYEIPGRLIDNPQEVFTPRRENSTSAQKDMPLFGMMGGPEEKGFKLRMVKELASFSNLLSSITPNEVQSRKPQIIAAAKKAGEIGRQEGFTLASSLWDHFFGGSGKPVKFDIKPYKEALFEMPRFGQGLGTVKYYWEQALTSVKHTGEQQGYKDEISKWVLNNAVTVGSSIPLAKILGKKDYWSAASTNYLVYGGSCIGKFKNS